MSESELEQLQNIAVEIEEEFDFVESVYTSTSSSKVDYNTHIKIRYEGTMADVSHKTLVVFWKWFLDRPYLEVAEPFMDYVNVGFYPERMF